MASRPGDSRYGDAVPLPVKILIALAGLTHLMLMAIAIRLLAHVLGLMH